MNRKELIEFIEIYDKSPNDPFNENAISEFVDGYLKNHPRPTLPTDEEIRGEGLKRRTTNTGVIFNAEVKWFMTGARWMRNLIEKNQ